MSVLREILARFGVEFDGAELKKGHEQVESTIGKLKEFGETMLAAFAVEKVAEWGKELLEGAEQVKVLSIALGTTTDELQGLDHAATQSGVSVDSLHGALGRLQKGAAEAAEKGTSPFAEAFKKLGVPLKNADGTLRTSGQLFVDTAQKIAGIENPTERAGIASKLFGRSYTQILPLLAKGKDGIANLTKEVDELGFGMNDAFIENSEAVLHNTDKLTKSVKGLAIQGLSLVLPELVKLTESGVAFAKTLVPLIRDSNILKSGFALLASKGVVALLSKIGGPGGLLTMLKTLGSFALEVVAPLLVLDDVLTFLGGGKSVTGDLLNKMFGKGTAERVRKDIQDIWEKLKAGAKQVVDEVIPKLEQLWESLKQKGSEAIDEVKKLWEELTKAVSDHADEIAVVVAGYVAYVAAVAGVAAAKAIYQAVLIIVKGAQIAYNAAVKAGEAAMWLYAAATDGTAIAAAAANVAFLPLLATVGAIAAAIGAVLLAYDQLKKLSTIAGGKSVVGQMIHQGTLNPFTAIDKTQNEQAKAAAAKRAGQPAGAAPEASMSVPPVTESNVTLTNSPQISVSVPPGTPQAQAKAVADAANAAVQHSLEDLRATMAAVNQTAG